MERKRRPIELLLVEDSPSDRLITLEVLERCKLLNTINVVEDGVEAMAYLRRQGKYKSVNLPDLVLLDLNLPRMDGRQVLAEIKVDPLLKYIPVVVLTTSTDEQDVLHAYGYHANSFINKPVNFDKFSRALEVLGDYWFEVVVLPPRLPAMVVAEAKADPTADSARFIRVLLVEDSPTDAMLIKEILLSAKFEVVVAQRVVDAEHLVTAETFDVVLADLGLPDSHGIPTLQKLRLAAGRLPVVVLTGNDNVEQGQLALREGAADYVFKSEIHSTSLARTLQHAFDRKKYEERLVKSSRMEALGQLAAGVAHEFNNLLTVIQGRCSLISEFDSHAPTLESVGEIERAADRAATLTHQLLTFTRRQKLRQRAVDLSTVAGRTIKMLQRILGGMIRVELRLHVEPLPISADAAMIEEAIVNLAINARDAMPSGGKLVLETERVLIGAETAAWGDEAYAGTFAVLKVTDTGQGIPDDVRPKIFEPFFTTKEVGKGTGLGLAAVQGVVQQHHGWVSVTSQVGLGTTFSLYFPLAEAASRDALEQQPAPMPELQGLERLVLIVDDEDAIRTLLRTMLASRGFRVIEAASAAQALAIWEERRNEIALLITDIAMQGGKTGLDLAQDIIYDKPDTPIIVTSGFDSEYFSRSTDIVKSFVFLAKPYSLRQLFATIQACLNDHQQGKQG